MSNRIQTVLSKLGLRLLFKGALMIGVLVLAGFLINQVDFDGAFRNFGFSSSADVGFWRGYGGFLVLGALATAVGAPRQVISFFSAYFFGLVFGLLLAFLATVGGCVIAYMIGRMFSQQAERFIGGRFSVALGFWHQNTFTLTLVIRLLPVGSNLITNLAAGASRIGAVPFVAGSALGYIPQTLVFAMMGSGVNVESETQIAVSIVLFVVSTLLGLSLYGRYRKSLESRAV